MARTDHYHDPDAPAANSVVPSTTAVVTDEHDRIVLIRRRDNDLWALPGGGMELGESIVDTAVREVKEETGLDVEVTGLIGVYTNPHHVMAYTDGEVRLLEEQDRGLWDREKIIEGCALADEALSRPSVDAYALQAAIAAWSEYGPLASPRFSARRSAASPRPIRR